VTGAARAFRQRVGRRGRYGLCERRQKLKDLLQAEATRLGEPSAWADRNVAEWTPRPTSG
jgi:hypothetical protein